jgi:arylsulfatase A-like enzyme
VGLVSTNGYLGYTSKLSRYYDLFDNQELGSAEIVVDNGLAMLEDLIGAERWFLHLHFFDPHSPYAPPEAYLGGLEGLAPIDYDLSQFAGVQELEGAWKDLGDEERELVLEHLRVRYEGSIAYLDDELERLWEGLEAAGALDEALVVIWSDHGEQFYEYGELEHGKSMHGVEVDTFVSFLGPNVAAQAWGEHTTHGDISPTIFEHLGLEPRQWEPASDLGGVGAVVGSADPGRPRFAVKRQGEETLHSVDLDGWRLIYTWEGEFGLYDLERDPGEVENLYEEEPGRAAELWAVLAPRVEALAAETEEAQPNLP